MHEYYASNRDKFKKGMYKFLALVEPELEKASGKKYHELFEEIWDYYDKYGYEEYMPYLCNLDYVMFGVLGAPLFREHTCFEDGDYCDFKLKNNARPLPYWPPVFTQGQGYK